MTTTPDGASPQTRRGAAAADPARLDPRTRRRRALTLLGMTLVAPGSAQLVGGNRRIGRIGLRIWLVSLAVLAVLALVWLIRRSVVIGLFTRPWILLPVALAMFAGAVLWAYLFYDTWRMARPRLEPENTRRGVAALTAVLVLVTSGSLAWGGVNVLAGRSAVMDVFGGNTSVDPTDGRYNVLLLGGDSGASRVGTRPDTIMLASIDVDTGKTVMFGFARETENINFRDGSLMKRLMPDGWNCGDQCLLNGLYTWAVEHRSEFPTDVKDPGAYATKEAVEALSGLDVHYYALVDLRGFQRLIDAVGGINLDVKKRTPIGGGTSRIKDHIEPGVQHLDGYHALWYARSRAGSSNPERMARQRCVLTALVQQINPQTMIFKFKDVAAVSGSVVQTDVPESDLGVFADLALKIREQKIKSVNFVPPVINPWAYDPQVILDKVSNTIEASERDDEPGSQVARPRSSSTATSSGSSESSGSGSSGSGSSGRTPSSSGAGDATADDLGSVCAPA